MYRYIALLRGINVGGHKKILMADLRTMLESIGLKDVQTYIQSGNVVFTSSEGKNLSEKISEAIKREYGFEVPVLIKKASEMEQIIKACSFSGEKKEKSYFTLLFEIPSEENIEKTNKLNYPNEEFKITKDCVYFFCATGYGQAKSSGNLFENKLKVVATARNYRTMMKLIALAQ